jgi:hypothetical protein
VRGFRVTIFRIAAVLAATIHVLRVVPPVISAFVSIPVELNRTRRVVEFVATVLLRIAFALAAIVRLLRPNKNRLLAIEFFRSAVTFVVVVRVLLAIPLVGTFAGLLAQTVRVLRTVRLVGTILLEVAAAVLAVVPIIRVLWAIPDVGTDAAVLAAEFVAMVRKNDAK